MAALAAADSSGNQQASEPPQASVGGDAIRGGLVRNEYKEYKAVQPQRQQEAQQYRQYRRHGAGALEGGTQHPGAEADGCEEPYRGGVEEAAVDPSAEEAGGLAELPPAGRQGRQAGAV